MSGRFRRRILSAVSVIALLLGAAGTASALAVPPAPPLDRPIVDQTGTLTSEQQTALADQIAASRKEKDYQIGILIISTLEDRDLEGYSLDVARTWGIGEKTKNNGVLLVIAKDDRRLRIEVGSGLEGDLTDAQSGRIITQIITPKFKQGDYYGGISDGVRAIHEAVMGRAPATQPAPSGGDIGSLIMNLGFFLLWGVVWLGSILARSKSWWAGGVIGGIVGLLIAGVAGWAVWALLLLVGLVLSGLGLDWLVSRNFYQRTARGDKPSWWAGGTYFGGGGSSGGGGSFGGGGFSGGGASGSW